jgi:hypothetical protein
VSVPAAKRYLIDLDRIGNAFFYSLSASSGSLTTIAAGTASAGHLFAARYVPAGSGITKLFHVTRLRLLWQTITGFTAQQEIALAAYKLTAYSAAHTAGNSVTPLPRASTYAASQLAARMASSVALTAGTQTVGSQLMRGEATELADTPLIGKGFIDEERVAGVHPIIVLAANEGILVRNEVLMGAAGVGRLTVELDGYERAQ